MRMEKIFRSEILTPNSESTPAAEKLFLEAKEAERRGEYRWALDLYAEHLRLACVENREPKRGLWTGVSRAMSRLGAAEKRIAELSPEEAGERYDLQREAETRLFGLLLRKRGELRTYEHFLAQPRLSLPLKREFEGKTALLRREISGLEERLRGEARPRLDLWRRRSDLRETLRIGADHYGLRGEDLTYARARERIEAQKFRQGEEAFRFASMFAPLQASPNAVKPAWEGQRGWGSVREFNGTEFLVPKKSDCRPDLDSPERIRDQDFVVVQFGAAWCKEPCRLMKSGLQRLAAKIPALKIATFTLYSEGPEGLAEIQKVRGHPEMTEIDWLAGHGRDERGYSRVGMQALPTIRVYYRGERIAEHQGAFLKLDKRGEPVFDEAGLMAFLREASAHAAR